jgi:hypothetical protein
MEAWLWRALAIGLVLGLWKLAFLLAGESWQVALCIPVGRKHEGRWQALVLTWYGILSACAYTVATMVFFFLLTAAGASLASVMAVTALVLGVCMPASRIVAGIVEGMRTTLTVGGAVFVALFVAPGAAWIAQGLWGGALWPVTLAAMGVAYALGEGVGRLACCSFGCCYGRPVESLPQPWRRLVAPWAVSFGGATKKAAYASSLEGVPLVPVQGMSAVVLTLAAWGGVEALAVGRPDVALVVAAALPQVWRVVSEMWRADFRGFGRVSPYQRMAVAGAVWTMVLAWMAGPGAPINLSQGWQVFGAPWAWALWAAVWVASLLFTGVSRVLGGWVDIWVRQAA